MHSLNILPSHSTLQLLVLLVALDRSQARRRAGTKSAAHVPVNGRDHNNIRAIKLLWMDRLQICMHVWTNCAVVALWVGPAENLQ